MPGSRDGTIPGGRSAAPALILLPALLYFNACGLGSLTQQESSGPAVQVGEESYSKADLNRFFDSRLNEFRDSIDVDVVKSALLDSFVEEKLLLQEANRLSIKPDPQDLKSMREGLDASQGTAPGISTKADQRMEQTLQDNLKIQRYLRDHLFKEISATKEECEAYYKDHLGEFISNDVVKVREILVDDEAKAQRIQALL